MLMLEHDFSQLDSYGSLTFLRFLVQVSETGRHGPEKNNHRTAKRKKEQISGTIQKELPFGYLT